MKETNVVEKEQTARAAAVQTEKEKYKGLQTGSGQTFKGEPVVIKDIFEASTPTVVAPLMLSNLEVLEMAIPYDALVSAVENFLKIDDVVKGISIERSLGKVGFKGAQICAVIDLDALKRVYSTGSVMSGLNKPSEARIDFGKLPEALKSLVSRLEIYQLNTETSRVSLMVLDPIRVLLNCVLAGNVEAFNAIGLLTSNFSFSYMDAKNKFCFHMRRDLSSVDLYKSIMRETSVRVVPLQNVCMNIDSSYITSADFTYSNYEVKQFATDIVGSICGAKGHAVLIDPYKTKILDVLTSEEDARYYREVLYSGTGPTQITRIIGLILPYEDFVVAPKNTGSIFSSLQAVSIDKKKIATRFSEFVSKDRKILLSVCAEGLLLVPEMHKILYKKTGVPTSSNLKIAFSTSPETMAVRLTRI